MAVYAEWWWSCDLCSAAGNLESAEEPWGDEQSAADELARHIVECHQPTEREPSTG